MLKRGKKAQSVTEYSIMFGVIIAGLIGLQIYFQRGVQGNIRERSDAVGDQFTTSQNYTIERQSHTLRSSEGGYARDGDFWSVSEILGSSGDSGLGNVQAGWHTDLSDLTKLDYQGHEVSRTRFVDQTVKGTGQVGDHGTFDSGVIGQITPWQDAGIVSSE